MSSIIDSIENMPKTNMNVSKAVQQVNDTNITDLSERIIRVQTLIDLHKQIRDNYERDFKKLARASTNSLKKGMPFVQKSLDQMDEALKVQRLMCDENDEVAKFARELLELLEKRQQAFRSMAEGA
jgi:transcriptional regulator of heat shock response